MKKAISILLGIGLALNLTACSVSLDTEEAGVDAANAKTEKASEETADAGDEKDGTKDGENEGDGSAAAVDLSGITIEVADMYTGKQSETFAELVQGFEEETGCQVEISEYGKDYENTLKTRMASNTLPDVFQTHGWSILRYKEYLMDLRNEPWVEDYDESALGVIQDEDGAIYVLMLSEVANGTLVNLDVCEAAGVDIYEIHTWADFEEACGKIKAAGYTPIGSEPNPGLLSNIAGTWVCYEGEMAEDSEVILDGTYDWKSFENLLQFGARCLDQGYFYEDFSTIQSTDTIERFINDKAAFMIGNGVTVLQTCYNMDPDGNFAYLPSFASKEGGQEFVGIGEGDTFGIWKDGKNIEAAKAFLEYMSRPEQVAELTNQTGNLVCLKSAMEYSTNKGLEYFNTMKEKREACDIRYENLWDRKYMPSGMWQIFGNAWNMMMEDHTEAGIAEVTEYLSENYSDLYEMAQES